MHFFENRLLTSKAGTAYKPLIDGEDAAGEPLGLLWCQAKSETIRRLTGHGRSSGSLEADSVDR
ncbi:hypothetical protein, partial [Aurantimonas marina]|uniref:hypothetical protein n=1 Tax=Aurantimonas marina TaxID=2780508 RepID=UPI0019D27D09